MGRDMERTKKEIFFSACKGHKNVWLLYNSIFGGAEQNSVICVLVPINAINKLERNTVIYSEPIYFTSFIRKTLCVEYVKIKSIYNQDRAAAYVQKEKKITIYC